jgi:hypothetical protein
MEAGQFAGCASLAAAIRAPKPSLRQPNHLGNYDDTLALRPTCRCQTLGRSRRFEAVWHLQQMMLKNTIHRQNVVEDAENNLPFLGPNLI